MTESRTWILDLVEYLSHADRIDDYRKIPGDIVPEDVDKLLKFLPEYFKQTGKDCVGDWHHVVETFEILHPRSKKQLPEWLGIAARLDARGPTTINDNMVTLFMERGYSLKIADTAIDAAAGEADFEDLYKLIDERTVEMAQRGRIKDVEIVSDPTADLMEQTRSGLNWPLKSMDRILGPISDHFCVVASRPDGGKTTLMTMIAAYSAIQLKPKELDVVLFINEESRRRVFMRLMSSAFQIDEAAFRQQEKYYLDSYEKTFGDTIKIIDHTKDSGQVERILARTKPGIILIDQLYKVQGNFSKATRSDNDAEQFRKLAEWARDLGKYVAPVVVTNQLDPTAEGEKWPTMEKLYGTKTGVQGEADAIIMLGRDHATPDYRYLYTPKNKLTGEIGAQALILHKEIARFEDATGL
jgi:replicative DNA helicase